ncbi:MAG: hypothetical protein JSS09_03030 [Verrucomicrobia bacterium]|nr:hypothetical protein [Verrucomicrobiota bacterium]
MKKMSILAAAMLGLCGSLVCGYADETASMQNCGFSADEQNFSSQLTMDNQMAFCKMTADQRASCMKMAQTTDAYGNTMTPDQAVQTMAVTGGCEPQ